MVAAVVHNRLHLHKTCNRLPVPLSLRSWHTIGGRGSHISDYRSAVPCCNTTRGSPPYSCSGLAPFPGNLTCVEPLYGIDSTHFCNIPCQLCITSMLHSTAHLGMTRPDLGRTGPQAPHFPSLVIGSNVVYEELRYKNHCTVVMYMSSKKIQQQSFVPPDNDENHLQYCTCRVSRCIDILPPSGNFGSTFG